MTDLTPVPYISEPARRIIERIAEAVFTMQRETATATDQAEAVARECQPLFEQLGVTNEGDGFGFDEDLFADPSSGAQDIIAERLRQQAVEGYSREHDDDHGDGSLAAAAAAYAFSAATAERYLAADPVGFWPWQPEWWKPSSPRRDLVKAGALIVAEIERIDRATAREATA